ncbi:MAG: nucleotidyltransferase domain-containing protein [Pirellulales bacterium]
MLSVGTQVVLLSPLLEPSGQIRYPRGSVGIIIEKFISTGQYRIRFIDQAVELVEQRNLTTLSKFKSEQSSTSSVESQLEDRGELYKHIILQCVIGSQAYGLASDASDIDRRGCYLAPAELQWSILGAPEQLECHETQECYWEVEKLIVLALKANPSVLECLYSPIVEQATELGQQLLAIRGCFLSQLIYQTFNGYVMSQFKRMQGDFRNRGEVRWKHVMHLLRLLHSGIDALNEGFVQVEVGDDLRERLLAIKRGEVPWDETEKWRKQLHQDFDRAARETKLPEKPDYDRANLFVIHARRTAFLSGS